MPAKSRLIFPNIVVSDLPAAQAFFGELGFEFNPMFTSEECACMVISEQAYVMLHSRESFERFATRPVAIPAASNEVLLCVSAESREEVDALADKALACGATPARDAQDYGFMYGRSFHDLDGHVWEIMWMDPAAVESGPPAEAQAAA